MGEPCVPKGPSRERSALGQMLLSVRAKWWSMPRATRMNQRSQNIVLAKEAEVAPLAAWPTFLVDTPGAPYCFCFPSPPWKKKTEEVWGWGRNWKGEGWGGGGSGKIITKTQEKGKEEDVKKKWFEEIKENEAIYAGDELIAFFTLEETRKLFQSRSSESLKNERERVQWNPFNLCFQSSITSSWYDV